MTEDTIKSLIKLTRDVDTSGNLTNDGLTVAYASNTYASGTFTSNNSINTRLDGFVANNSLNTRLDGFVANNSLNTRLGGFTSNNSLNTRLGGFVANSFFQDNQPSSFGVVSATVVNGAASGTYTVPAGINYIAGVVVGGGGGGGANERISSHLGGGDGGGGGICGFGFGVTPGATYTYSIGAGGNRGTWNNNFFTNAGAGGTSNFHGNVFRGNGGSPGINNSGGTNSNVTLGSRGASGGNATGGRYNVTGAVGTTTAEGLIHKGLVAGVLGALGGSTVDKNGTVLSNASTIGSATVGQGGQGSVGGFNEDGYAGSAGSLIVYEFG